MLQQRKCSDESRSHVGHPNNAGYNWFRVETLKRGRAEMSLYLYSKTKTPKTRGKRFARHLVNNARMARTGLVFEKV